MEIKENKMQNKEIDKRTNDAVIKKYVVILNIIASLGVVYLHVNKVFWEFSYDNWWISANAIECLFYFSVPVFFMLSGCNLMDYRERYSTKEYIIKRIRKTVIPFIFWNGIIAFICECMIAKTSLRGALDNFLNSRYIGGIFWFFIPLFGIYMSIPFLSLIPKDIREKNLGYFLIICFIVEIFIPNIFKFIEVDTGLTFPIGGVFVLCSYRVLY